MKNGTPTIMYTKEAHEHSPCSRGERGVSWTKPDELDELDEAGRAGRAGRSWTSWTKADELDGPDKAG
jgi:hypothetical protein